MSGRRLEFVPPFTFAKAVEPKDRDVVAADRRGLLVAKIEALVIEHGLEEVTFALRVATEDRGG